MKSIVIKFGLIGGVIISALMCLTIPMMNEDSNMEMGQLIGYATMLIALSTIFIGVRNFRNNQNGGVITFGKAFKIGFLIALIASTCYVITWMIMSATIMSDFMDQYIAASIAKMEASDMPRAEMAKSIEDMNQMAEMYKNPFFKILITYAEMLPVGILVSLISAAILRKK